MYESRDGRAEGGDVLARLDEVVAALGELVDAVADCTRWTAAQRVGALARLDKVAGVSARVRATVVVAEQAAGTSVRPGDRDFAAARARATRTGLGEARREVRRAEALVALPAVADAVEVARMPVAHLDALARVTAGAGEVAAAALAAPEGQERLVRMAERLSVKEFAGAVARLVASFDPAALDESAERQYQERYLRIAHQPDGTYLNGRVDRVAGEQLRVALASMGQVPGADRDRAQADADALVMLVGRALTGMAGVRARRVGVAGEQVPDPEQDAADARVSGVAARPVVSILVPAETFAEVRAAQQRAGFDAAQRWWEAVGPATLEDGTPVSMSELGRALCDCELGRIVMGADSMPLDVGRTARLFTSAQRRAIVVRDRACAWNGCEVPAAWCEAHHIRWWDRDTGPTSVENGVLLCSHHHHVVHQMDLAIVRLIQPPGRAAPERSRGRRTGAPPDEPTRYEFHTRDRRLINAPSPLGEVRPGVGCGSEACPSDGSLFEVA